ncbi:hypothetical protein THRCLA_23368 [Thraustotheca clavata]|uniref:Transmembrane protein n=1 Tax=Thraustotheca clavata TaxID=74557 RepID=A0A1V9Y6W4_9STRA|nr:hypothetical protein THRCLA_23368 [Thraustotheca clavata]
MEEELIAQRDVALEMAKQLKKQEYELQIKEKIMERRLEWSETKRIEHGAKLKQMQLRMKCMAKAMHNELWLLLVCGLLGGFGGWCLGLCIVLLNGPPVLAFLLLAPFVAGGVFVGVASVLVQRKHRDWQPRNAENTRGITSMAISLGKDLVKNE